MLVWFAVNIAISALAFLFIGLSNDSPHRLRFILCFLALFSWLLPWKQISPLVPDYVDMPDAFNSRIELLSSTPIQGDLSKFNFEEAGYDNKDPISSEVPILVNISIPLICMFVLFLIGIFQFIHRLRKHSKRMAQMKANSHILIPTLLSSSLLRNLSIYSRLPTIRVQTLERSAFTSGFMRPTIWVNDSLLKSQELNAVILHEHVHIKQFDNYYLLVINLVECLMWWNPLVRVLAVQTRKLLELSCDENCKNQLPDYQTILAKLIVGKYTGKPIVANSPLAAYAYSSGTFDAERVKLLSEERSFKIKHVILMSLLLVGVYLSISLTNVNAAVLHPIAKDKWVMSDSIGDEIDNDRIQHSTLIQSEGPAQQSAENGPSKSEYSTNNTPTDTFVSQADRGQEKNAEVQRVNLSDVETTKENLISTEPDNPEIRTSDIPEIFQNSSESEVEYFDLFESDPKNPVSTGDQLKLSETTFPTIREDVEQGEIIFIEDLSRSQLRAEILKIETEFYRVFNISTKKDYLEIVCETYMPTGSYIRRRYCEPRFLIDARSENVNIWLDKASVLQTSAEMMGINSEFEELAEAMNLLLKENQYFRELNGVLKMLRVRLKELA